MFWWDKEKVKLVKRVALFLAVILMMGLILWAAYLRFVRGIGWAPWTGIGPYTPPTPNTERGKTLWDLLDLLIVPIFIAVGVWWLDQRQKKAEREFEQARLKKDREIAREKRQDATLEAYFDRMTALLLEEGLGDPNASEKVEKIARTRTRVVMQRLDGKHNGYVVQFLMEAKLISANAPLLSLRGVNLEEASFVKADLVGAELAGTNLALANLHGADMNSANLESAYLTWAEAGHANLNHANLQWADLEGVNFQEASLRHSNLRGAFLHKAKLQDADLRNADLRGAHYDEQDLKGANLKGTILE